MMTSNDSEKRIYEDFKNQLDKLEQYLSSLNIDESKNTDYLTHNLNKEGMIKLIHQLYDGELKHKNNFKRRYERDVKSILNLVLAVQIDNGQLQFNKFEEINQDKITMLKYLNELIQKSQHFEAVAKVLSDVEADISTKISEDDTDTDYSSVTDET